MAIDKKAFGKLSTADQQVVSTVLTELYARYDKLNVAEEAAAKQALFKAGMQKVVPEQEQLAQLRSALKKSNDAIAAAGMVSSEMYKELLALVAKYRAGEQLAAE